ncbi:MAG: sulfatase-like hydrolase/transferase [Ferruginibacter sp.]
MKQGLTGKYYSFKKNEKAAAIFLLKLLILLFLLKSFFYFYNSPVIGQAANTSGKRIFTLLKWSFENDALVLLLINTPFLLLLSVLSFLKRKKITVILLTAVFLLINFTCMWLNLVDVFYFHFHLQRADADLLYVLQHPFQKTFIQNPASSGIGLIVIIGLLYLLFLFHKCLLKHFDDGKRFVFTSMIMVLCCVYFFISGTRKFIPTYPLVELNSSELQLVQNSFHTFFYSVYRKDEAIIRPYDLLPVKTAERLMPINRPATPEPGLAKKNIVLFIMESIPEDFFNVPGKYKVTMPFLDSIVMQSTYFSNAYSYGHSSNKGIVSILTGIPTLTEIPLYHSNYAGMQITAVGTRLATAGYTSSFFIGDGYDDFGFAKCCNWLGIQHYYSKESIPGNRNMETNTMGLHDQYVLDFMGNKMNEMKQPFFAVNYNTSTHYPNDLPGGYKEKYPQKNISDQMKCMNYYNECLQQFFSNASKKSWYNHTVFIFCSDHWMYPDANDLRSDIVQGFHIPIFIYDPGKQQQKVINSPVSQLDVLNTILHIAGTKEPFISYGNNLLDSVYEPNRVVFSKENNNLYQVTDSSYVLGFNPVTRKAEFCYDYRADARRINNLVSTPNIIVDSLVIKMKAFLQIASYHYNKLGSFK